MNEKILWIIAGHIFSCCGKFLESWEVYPMYYHVLNVFFFVCTIGFICGVLGLEQSHAHLGNCFQIIFNLCFDSTIFVCFGANDVLIFLPSICLIELFSSYTVCFCRWSTHQTGTSPHQLMLMKRIAIPLQEPLGRLGSLFCCLSSNECSHYHSHRHGRAVPSVGDA